MTTTTATTFEGKNQLINMHSDFYKDVDPQDQWEWSGLGQFKD